MAKKNQDFDYSAKDAELASILAQLQDSEIQIDEATKLHASGLKLLDELEMYLKQAENEVRKHASET